VVQKSLAPHRAFGLGDSEDNDPTTVRETVRETVHETVHETVREKLLKGGFSGGGGSAFCVWFTA
jgi:hypothetical protein